MSEDGANSVAEAKISEYKSKIDGAVEKVLGIVGDHPWEKWLSAINEGIAKFMPAIIAVAAVVISKKKKKAAVSETAEEATETEEKEEE